MFSAAWSPHASNLLSETKSIPITVYTICNFLFWIPFWAKWATSCILLARAPSTAATLGPVPEYTFDRHLELWYFAVNTSNIKQYQAMTLKGKSKVYWEPTEAWARDRCFRPRGGTLLYLHLAFVLFTCTWFTASPSIRCLIERLLASDKAFVGSAHSQYPRKAYCKIYIKNIINK